MLKDGYQRTKILSMILLLNCLRNLLKHLLPQSGVTTLVKVCKTVIII